MREKATTILPIPGFDGVGTIDIRVKKPRLMAMASQGQIPNHLMGVVIDIFYGRKEKKKDKSIKDLFSIYEIYCAACMVEPTYEEMKDIITDDQMSAIFNWGMGRVNELDSFRKDEGNGSSDNNGKKV